MSVRPARYDATIQACCFSRLFIRPGFGKQWLPRQRQRESKAGTLPERRQERTGRQKLPAQAMSAGHLCRVVPALRALCRHWRPRAQSQQGHWVGCGAPDHRRPYAGVFRASVSRRNIRQLRVAPASSGAVRVCAVCASGPMTSPTRVQPSARSPCNPSCTAIAGIDHTQL